MGSQVQFGCLVPAAGASRRMGTNKLQLPFRGSTVLRSTLSALAPLPFVKRVVVCKAEDFPAPDVQHNENFHWVDGSQSKTLHQSIRLGLHELRNCEAVLVALADQPWLEQKDYESVLQEYQQAFAEGFRLLRPWNGQIPGNPCVLHQSFFPEIFGEPDEDRGCAYLFQRHPSAVKRVALPAKFFQDLDTQEDYQKWNS